MNTFPLILTKALVINVIFLVFVAIVLYPTLFKFINLLQSKYQSRFPEIRKDDPVTYIRFFSVCGRSIFKTPDWLAGDSEAKRMLLIMRVFGVLWNVGMVFLFIEVITQFKGVFW